VTLVREHLDVETAEVGLIVADEDAAPDALGGQTEA